nr:putative ORF1 [Marmot picobirnavirus]
MTIMEVLIMVKITRERNDNLLRVTVACTTPKEFNHQAYYSYSSALLNYNLYPKRWSKPELIKTGSKGLSIFQFDKISKVQYETTFTPFPGVMNSKHDKEGASNDSESDCLSTVAGIEEI